MRSAEVLSGSAAHHDKAKAHDKCSNGCAHRYPGAVLLFRVDFERADVNNLFGFGPVDTPENKSADTGEYQDKAKNRERFHGISKWVERGPASGSAAIA